MIYLLSQVVERVCRGNKPIPQRRYVSECFSLPYLSDIRRDAIALSNPKILGFTVLGLELLGLGLHPPAP
jgi:hypothetical protein